MSLLKRFAIAAILFSIFIVAMYIRDEMHREPVYTELDYRTHVEYNDNYRPEGFPKKWSTPHPYYGTDVIRWYYLKKRYYQATVQTIGIYNVYDMKGLRHSSHIEGGEMVMDTLWIPQVFLTDTIEVPITHDEGGILLDDDGNSTFKRKYVEKITTIEL